MIKIVSVIDTTYDLFLSILFFADSKSQNIHFFVGETISDGTVARLPHYTQFYRETFDESDRSILRRLVRYIKWPFLFYAEIIAQDHLFFSPYIIGHRCYVLLEDSPYIYSWVSHSSLFRQETGSRKKKLAMWLLYGPTYLRPMGRNFLCKKYIVTSKTNFESKYLADRNVSLYNINESWASSSAEKKFFIMNLFNVTSDFIQEEQQYKCVLFTQPFMCDFDLTEEEQVEYYRPYIERYAHLGIAIKVHPRDKVDYKKSFPNIHILHTQAPMQLLTLCGLNYKVAITGFSTAVCDLEKTEIVWIGTKECKKIFNVVGDVQRPI